MIDAPTGKLAPKGIHEACTKLDLPENFNRKKRAAIFPKMVMMVTIGDDLQPGNLAGRLLTSFGQPQINPLTQKEREKLRG
jgi:hypothetical protein